MHLSVIYRLLNLPVVKHYHCIVSTTIWFSANDFFLSVAQWQWLSLNVLYIVVKYLWFFFTFYFVDGLISRFFFCVLTRSVFSTLAAVVGEFNHGHSRSSCTCNRATHWWSYVEETSWKSVRTVHFCSNTFHKLVYLEFFFLFCMGVQTKQSYWDMTMLNCLNMWTWTPSPIDNVKMSVWFQLVNTLSVNCSR